MVIIGIAGRTFFPHDYLWPMEYAVFNLIMLAFIGSIGLFSTDEHINIDFMLRNLTIKQRKIWDVVYCLIVIIVFSLLMYSGISIANRTRGMYTYGGARIPLVIFYLPIIIFSAGLVISGLVRLWSNIVILRSLK